MITHEALPVSSRDLALRHQCFNPREQRTQHGVDALDGGDADAADAVELRALQVLDVVKLGELAAVVGRAELLVPRRRDQGLIAEVAAPDEEEDAARASELDEAVNEVDGGVGLAAAGGHLDEGAALVGGRGSARGCGWLRSARTRDYS